MSPRNEADTDNNRSRGAGGVWWVAEIGPALETKPVDPVAEVPAQPPSKKESKLTETVAEAKKQNLG